MIRVTDPRACARCGRPGASRDPDGAPWCESCQLDAGLLAADDGIELQIGPGPELRWGEVVLAWDRIGEVIEHFAGRSLVWKLGPPLPVFEDRPPSEPVVAEPTPATLGPTFPADDGPLPPLRDPVDEDEADAWAEAVGLLADCLPPSTRDDCPLEPLRLACHYARARLAAGDELWLLIAEGAGWDADAPREDRDLWTAAAMCLVSVAVDAVEVNVAECLDSMEPSDWLATIVELVRAGPGTALDAESLLALSARCLDVDSAAADPTAASSMTVAFEALIPVWQALDAIDAEGALTALGAWGLPLALARAWAGWLPT